MMHFVTTLCLPCRHVRGPERYMHSVQKHPECLTSLHFLVEPAGIFGKGPHHSVDADVDH